MEETGGRGKHRRCGWCGKGGWGFANLFTGEEKEVADATRIDGIREGGEGGSSPAMELTMIPLCQDPGGSLTINRWKRGKLGHWGLRSINCRN
jgi:hypothetical protein